MKKIGLISIIIFFIMGCTAPQYENCQIEIITIKNDTIIFVDASIEFERTLEFGNPRITITRKNGGKYKFVKRYIKRMTIIYERDSKWFLQLIQKMQLKF